MKSKKIDTKELFFSRTWDFLNEYMPNRLNRSRDTIESYRDSLSAFRHFVTDEYRKSLKEFRFCDCTRDCIFDFRDYLKKRGNAPSTVNVRVTAIHSYLAYAAEDDVSLQSLSIMVSSIPPLKVTKREKVVISTDGLAAMLDAPAQSKIGMRDRAFMILLYDSAVRLNEILSLRLKDVFLNGEYPCILLHGKGNKERRAIIDPKTAQHIRNYMQIYHPQPNQDDYLFYTKIKGMTGKMSHGNGQRIVNKYASMARAQGIDLPEKVHPHMFRRTKATLLYQNGVPLEMVSTLLGHSQLETTKIYARPSEAQLKEAMDKVSSPASEEKPIWTNDEETLAKLAGLR